MQRSNIASSLLHGNAFDRLRKKVFDDRDLVHTEVVLPTLLCCSETWSTHRHHLKVLEKYHPECFQ